MKHRGAFTVFATAFAVVLLGGLALAQVGVLSTSNSNSAPVGEIAAVTDSNVAPVVTPDAPDQTTRKGGDAPDEPATETPANSTDDETGGTPDGSEPAGGTATANGSGGDGKSDDGADKDDEGAEGGGDDTTAPRIEILHPEDGAVFHEKTIAFEGISEPGAKVTAGRYAADVNEKGGWRIVLVLADGRNVVRLTATDAAGNSADDTVTVIYEPKTEEPPRVEFTAHQKYGSSTAKPPFDDFYGTAKPGSKIWIESEFGGASVVANSRGGWEARVVFAEAPVGKAIRVVIESNDGGRKVFEFVNKGNDEGVRHEFTANQTYGSCGEEIPYDVFYGRADAGERIWVESTYGSGVAEANADGHWEIKVKFPEAPPGKVFEVVIEAEHGGRTVFQFVNTRGVEK